jgi:M6 family metalloprotease-like protein
MRVKNVSFISVFMAILAVILALSALTTAPAQAEEPQNLAGWFTILRSYSESDGASQTFYFLTPEEGGPVRLILDEESLNLPGGIQSLEAKWVSLEGFWLESFGETEGQPVFQVVRVTTPQAFGPEAAGRLVSGSQPWISIMCKFNDIAAEPKDLAYFQGMYSGTRPGLDHYWREVSYNTVNIVGSNAVGWYTLPQPRSYYVYNGSLDFDRAARDCTGVADPFVNFTGFVGINLMFNADLDGYAWGGSHYLTLDGVSKAWRMTWEPPWGYSDITVIAHEMGHGFGLPHSSGQYGATYDNVWDVMSDAWRNCAAVRDATYGCLGQHTIAYHKDMLGWIPTGQRYIAGSGSATITLEQLALPETSNYRIARIPIPGSSSFYTVEVRRKVGYDVKLPGNAVVIHNVNPSRANQAQVIDADGNGDTADAGAMWTVGETFNDAANGISVTVVSATATGFQVTITTPSLPPASFGKVSPVNGATGQPSGPTLSWQASSGAASYEYCYDTTNDGLCATWVSAGTATSVTVSGLLSNTTYYWQVRALNGFGMTYANGSSSAFWSFSVASAPANDDFDNAIRINLPYTNTQSIAGAGTPADDPYFSCTSGQRSMSVWYKLTPVVSGNITVDTIGSNYDTILSVWKGARGSLTSVACNDDDPGLDLLSRLTFTAQAGTTYYIEVASYSSSPTGTTLKLNAVQISGGTFADVPGTYWAWSDIERVYKAGLTGGCGTNPLVYCPNNPVTRGQMAVFLLKGIYGPAYTPPPASGTVFADVPASHPFAAWIERLFIEGISAGCGNGNYCPSDSINRAQMAVFLLKARHGTAYVPPAVGVSTGFSDVPTTHWAAAWIKQLAAEGITGGCSASNYCPEQPVTRAQMAVFLVRAFDLP